MTKTISAKVSGQGRVTIPKGLRKKLGIRSGTFLKFEIKGKFLKATKFFESDPVEKVYGCLKKLNQNQKLK